MPADEAAALAFRMIDSMFEQRVSGVALARRLTSLP